MNPGNLSQITEHWYVTANDCDVVLRVLPDMSLGESETGEISLDDDGALLSLSIDGDGSLEVFVLSGELESEDGEFAGKRLLAFDSAALIKLPNNTLRLDRDILGGGESDASLLPCVIWRTAGGEAYAPAVGSVDTTEAPPALDLYALESSSPSVPEPSAPEPSVPILTDPVFSAPEPSVPKPSVPKPSVPKPSVPVLTASALSAAEPSVPVLTEPKITLPEITVAELGVPARDEPNSVPVIKERPTPQKLPGKTPGNHKNRKNFFPLASAGLVCLFVWLVYPVILNDLTPEQPVPVADGIVNRQTADQLADQLAIEQVPTVALPSELQIGDKNANAAAPVATPATAASKTTAAIVIPPKEPIADDLVSTPEPEPEPEPETEVAVAERETTRNTVASAESTRSQPANRNPQIEREGAVAAQAVQAIDEVQEQEVEAVAEVTVQEVEAPVAVEPETVAAVLQQDQEEVTQEAVAQEELTVAELVKAEPQSEPEQAQVALLLYERDLLAAELALAQGRLTHPPENSAYTLFQKLVASNPESPEARRGFQALGPALVNRAFAEVAARRWSDAQATLAAAAEVGASPSLVADLSRDVAYQQRLADAEAGRFDTLYPEAELVALNRTTPRLRRYAPDGMNTVQIEFTISVAGDVQDIEVLGAPPQRLERVVRQAVTDWRFEPVLSGTRPIPVRTRIGLKIP